MSKKQANQPTLTRRILAADLPNDARLFTLDELTAAGILGKYVGSEYRELRRTSERLFKLLVLVLEQNRRLKSQALESKTAPTIEEIVGLPLPDTILKSPLLVQLRNQYNSAICPLQRAKLSEAISNEKARLSDKRRQTIEHMRAVIMGSTGDYRDRLPVKQRDALWHLPMTRLDYVEATGRTLRTIRSFLKSINAQPLEPRKRRNEPERYGSATNYEVMRHWLTKWENDVKRRRIFLVRTVCYCRQHAPAELKRLLKELHPVVKYLKLRSKAERDKFELYFDAVWKLYEPPRELASPFAQFLGGAQ